MFCRKDREAYAGGLLKKIIIMVRRIWKRFLILRSVECGTPVALGSTISVRDDADRETVLEKIIQQTEQIADELGVKVILFRDYFKEELPLMKQLERRGYMLIENLPGAHFSVRWNKFSDYLKEMRSEYRRRIEKRIRVFQSGIVMEEIKNFSEMSAILVKLWKNTYDRAKEYRREVLTEEFFVNMDQSLGNRSSVIVAKSVDKIVGFSLLLRDEDTLITLFCGLDYSESESFYIYFNLFYETIRIAIKEGMKKIDLGITTLLPKIELGGEIVHLYMYMKHMNPLLNKFVPRAFSFMTPRQKLIPQRIFKSDVLSESDGSIKSVT